MTFGYRGKIFRKEVIRFPSGLRYFLATDTVDGGTVFYEYPLLENMNESTIPESKKIKEKLDRECFTPKPFR